MKKLVNIEDERFWQILFDEACVEGQQAERIRIELEKILEPEEQRWILCSEALPEKDKQVAVLLYNALDSDEYRQVSIARRIRLSDGNTYWCDKYKGYLEHEMYKNGYGGSSEYRVLAWYPLPESNEKEE